MNWTFVQSDGADIRVTNSDGFTLLKIWLEEFNYGAHTGTLWIKLPASSSGDLYLYTGKPDAPSVSSGDDTFLLFDHFLGSSLDTGKWNQYKSGGSTITVGSSEVYVYCPAVSNIRCLIYDKSTHAYPITIGVRSKGAGSYPCIIAMGDYTGSPPNECNNNFLLGRLHIGDGYIYGRQRKAGAQSEQLYTAASDWGNYHRYEVKWWANNIRYFRDWVSLGSSGSNVPTASLYAMLGGGTWGQGYAMWVRADFIYLRKYVATEPTGVLGPSEYHLVLTENLALLESLPVTERKLPPFEEAIALRDVSSVPACPDVVLTEALALKDVSNVPACPDVILQEALALKESLPLISRALLLEEAIALKETLPVIHREPPALEEAIALKESLPVIRRELPPLEEALALAESFIASEQTIVRATATAEFLAEQAKRSNQPAKRIWLYINSSLYDITDKFMSMGPIDRKMTYKPGETRLLTISDQNLVMSNADRYFSDLNPSSPFYNRDYAGADQIKVFAGFIIPETGYAEVLEKADMKLIAIELATKEAKAFLTCQDSLRDIFDIYVGMPTSEGVSDPLIYENKSFKYIMDDLLINKAGILSAKVDIEDVDLTFTSISFEKKKIADCVEKLSEVARGTTVVLGDGTVKFEQFISESIDPELALESGKNFSTLQYLGSDSRYRIKKVVVIGQAGVYGESSGTVGIELKVENDAIEEDAIAQAMADIYLGKFRIAPAKMKLRGEYLPSLDLKSIVEVTEPNSMMNDELLQVKELALDIVSFSTRLTLSVPGRFVGWTNTGGGDHEGDDWIIASDVEVGGIHTNIGTFKVNAGVTATVKGYDGSTHGAFEIHAVDVDVDGAIIASEKGCGGGGAGGGGGGGRYLAGQQGSGGSGGSGIVGGYDGVDGGPGRRTDEDIGGNGGAGGNGGGGTGAGIKGAGGNGAHGNVGVDHVPAVAGGAGGNGGYGSTPNDNDDVSVDESLLRGKGGGAGGGGGGGDAEVILPSCSSGAGAGGGGAGGYGAGWIKLYATTSIDISGNLTAKGNSGGNGGNGGNAQSGTHPANLNGGNGGAGGNAATPGTRSGGSKGTARWSTQNGANGGNGGHGAGGGLLLQCDANAISVAGMLDNRGGGDAAANGGTIKVFYTTGDPTGAGTWYYGRLYKEDIS